MRVQLALNVEDLEAAIDFYEKMFDTPVSKRKDGYANFEVANPPLKLVLFEAPGEGGLLNHLGVEVEEKHQVSDAEQRIARTGLETTGIDETVCCYAQKTETWVEGPDNRWEWYVKNGDAETLENEIISSSEPSTASCCQ